MVCSTAKLNAHFSFFLCKLVLMFVNDMHGRVVYRIFHNIIVCPLQYGVGLYFTTVCPLQYHQLLIVTDVRL